MPEEKPGCEGAWCSDCGRDLGSVPQGEPCPDCGSMARTCGVAHHATATGTPSTSKTVKIHMAATTKGEASMSKTVGKTLSVVSKGVPSFEATWEEWQELRERNLFWTAVEVGVTFGPVVAGYFVDKTTGALIGGCAGMLSWWVGPKAERTVRERVRKRQRTEGE